MQINPQEIERLIESSNRHDHFDRTAIAIVDGVVICAIAVYFIASTFSVFFP
jgi:hypothetical protein